MKQWKKFFNKQRSLIALLALVVTSIGTVSLLSINNKIKLYQTLNDGVQTCFSRTNQTYTASVTGAYVDQFLKDTFLMMSEECYAELLAVAEAQRVSNGQKLLKNLNEYSSKAAFINSKLGKKVIDLSGANGNKLQTMSLMVALEDLKYEILEQNQKEIDKLSSSSQYLKLFLVILGVLLLFVSVWQVILAKKKSVKNDQIENDAKLELESEELVRERATKIIHQALNENDLHYTNQLFIKITEIDRLKEQSLISSNEETKIIAKPISIPVKNILPTQKVVIKNEINLQKVISNVISLLASEIHENGAEVDFNIDEKIFVQGKEEDFQQLFYNLVKMFLANQSSTDGVKKIVSEVKILGGTLLLEFKDNTKGYATLLGQAKTTEMQICEEIASDLAIGLQFTNHLNARKEIVGGKFQLILRLTDKLSENSEKKVVSVRKFTKKEFLSQQV